MLTRFDLFVMARNQVSDRTLLRRYLAVEAGMEGIADQTIDWVVDNIDCVLLVTGSPLFDATNVDMTAVLAEPNALPPPVGGDSVG